MRRRIHACHMKRRIHSCHLRRRIHACHMRIYIYIYAYEEEDTCMTTLPPARLHFQAREVEGCSHLSLV
jgi:hypothetical protein